MNASPDTARLAAGRRSLLALVLVCALPFVAAWLLMAFPDWRPEGRSQRGELFDPVVPLAGDVFHDLAGASFEAQALNGKWTLAWLATEPCDAACDRPLGVLQRVRRLLGEHTRDAQVLAILLQPPADPAWRARMQADRMTRVIAGPPATLTALAAQLRADTASARFFILDPRGRLVLRYAGDAPWREMLEDLQHLLRYVKFE
ncbi:MAG TPA: hypothetical protein PJ986_16145 [Gammaproteobacteria bacterium]|nr:hypothetical protein [Gammaproteobacteria bacterium]